MMPLMQAKIQEAFQHVPEMRAHTEALQAQAGLHKEQQDVLKARQDAADQLMNSPEFASMDPTLKLIAREGLLSGHINPDQLGITPKAKAEAGKAEAETAKTKYETEQVLPSEVTLHGAEAERARAEALKAGREPAGGVKPKLTTVYGPAGATREEAVGPGYDPVKAIGPGWSLTKGPTPEALQAKALSALNTFKGVYGGPPTIDPMGTRTKAWHDNALSALVAEGIPHDVAEQTVSSVTGGAMTNAEPAIPAPSSAPLPVHAKSGEGLEAGSKPTGDPDGSWFLPDGKTRVWPK